MYSVGEGKEYKEWFTRQTIKEQAQIHARILRIRTSGHFGRVRQLTENLAELKWANGRRIYFTVTEDESG